MKKILVLALAIVMALSVVALVACDNGQTVTGEVHYNSHSTEYGVKVDVTVKGGRITAVKLYEDSESGYVRTSADNAQYGWTRYQATEDAYPQYIKDAFIGKTVEAVNAYVVTVNATEQTVGANTPKIADSTQSAARIIAAVQNALSKLAK